jgi:hypothetical protein
MIRFGSIMGDFAGPPGRAAGVQCPGHVPAPWHWPPHRQSHDRFPLRHGPVQ